MRNLILVGGPSRSGTVSTTSYLHLSDSVFMFSSGGPMIQLPKTPSDTWYTNKAFRPSTLAVGASKHNDLKSYINNKNKFGPENINPMYIGLRYDYAEKYRKTIFRLLQQYNTIKLIYCMRQDIEKLHISQRHNSYQRDIPTFKDRIDASYKNAVALKQDKELASNGFSIHAIDITVGGDDFISLDKFLGLEPNELQVKWQQQNIQTNQRNPDKMKEVLKIKYNKVLLTQVVKYLELRYNDTRMILNA